MIIEKLNQLTVSVDALNDNANSALSHYDERLLAIEKLMWKIEKKLLNQNKILKLLSRNELIDQLVTRKYYEDRVKPFHLMTEEERLQTIEAMYDDEDD